MAHMTELRYCEPGKHKEVERDVNYWEYPIDGPTRCGFVRPYCSEVKLIDVRIPKEVMPMYVRDIGHMHWSCKQKNKVKMGKDHVKQGAWFVSLMIKLLRLFSPFKGCEKADGKKMYSIKPAFYAFQVGYNNDPIQENKLGEKREIL